MGGGRVSSHALIPSGLAHLHPQPQGQLSCASQVRYMPMVRGRAIFPRVWGRVRLVHLLQYSKGQGQPSQGQRSAGLAQHSMIPMASPHLLSSSYPSYPIISHHSGIQPPSTRSLGWVTGGAWLSTFHPSHKEWRRAFCNLSSLLPF